MTGGRLPGLFGISQWLIAVIARVIITPKDEVLDPQGQAVQNALEQLGCAGVRRVRVGKYIELELNGERAAMERQLAEYADRFLANPNIENFRLQFEE